METESKPQTTRLGLFADRVEGLLFPLIFLFLACKSAFKLYSDWHLIVPAVKAIDIFHPHPTHLVTASTLMTYTHLVIYNLLIAFLIFRRRAPERTPDNAVEIIIPVIATFGTMAYSLVLFWLPKGMDSFFLPPSMRFWPLVFGTCLSAFGFLMSLVAISQLNTNFGIFVQVREVVMGGLYQYVRHPIYSAYLIIDIGLLMIRPTVSYLIVTIGFTLLTIYRATLEEAKLSDYSPEYAEYRKRTPMLIPRFWPAPKGPSK